MATNKVFIGHIYGNSISYSVLETGFYIPFVFLTSFCRELLELQQMSSNRAPSCKSKAEYLNNYKKSTNPSGLFTTEKLLGVID